MKKFYLLFSAFLLSIIAGVAQESDTIHVVIETNVGTMKAILYNDVPNHVRTFVNRARQGEYNGTLFTRVVPEFMIQGGAPDSKTAPAGARCGFGDPSAEILPEINEKYFHKRGALAAPRQPDDINPQKKSDMSQFFIVHGDATYLDGQYAAFGKVVDGMDVVDEIANIPTGYMDRPRTDMRMKKVTLIEDK